MFTANLPPSPKSRFIVGHLLDYNRDPIGFLSRCTREHGDIVHLRFGKIPLYLLNHPDYIEEVLVTKNRYFIKSRAIPSHRRLLGNGLLTSDGDFWQRQRRLAQPAFHRDRITAYAHVMVADTKAMLATWQDGEIRDIHQEMMELTLGIVLKVLFDVDLAGETKDVSTALAVVMEHFSDRLSNILLPAWLPTPGRWRFQKAVQRLDEIVYGIIDQQRSSGKDVGDLLSMLLHAKDESDGSQMSNEQLRDEVMTIFLAGHETTANALSWTWLLLSQYPDVERKLVAELQAVLGGRAPTVHDLPQLQYTERIILESMRLYPPAWLIARTAVQDCEIGGYPVPAGTFAFMSQWLMQRDARFFDNPEAFNPDRWANDLAKRLPPYAYFPFGGGPRLCIGKAFAMMEAVLILAAIAQQFRLTLVPEHPVRLHPSITLRPKHGIKMLLAVKRE